MTVTKEATLAVGPWGDSVQQVPHDLFVLVQEKLITHREFFFIAALHYTSGYRSDGSVKEPLSHLEGLTGIPVRSLVRVTKALTKKGYISLTPTGPKGAAGYPVNEYIINWPAIHRAAAPERERRKGLKRSESTQGGLKRKRWTRCEYCGGWVHPLKTVKQQSSDAGSNGKFYKQQGIYAFSTNEASELLGAIDRIQTEATSLKTFLTKLPRAPQEEPKDSAKAAATS